MAVGLPPATDEGIPECARGQGEAPCNGTDLINQLKIQRPVFAPNQQSTYSNDNFNILGLVLENVTGLEYSEYIKTAIFDPLNLTFASLETPSDEHAVLPVDSWYWDVEEAVQRPTGGIYGSGSDMSKFLRYVLTHFNAIATGVNWFMPASFSGGTKNCKPGSSRRTKPLLINDLRTQSMVCPGKSTGPPICCRKASGR